MRIPGQSLIRLLLFSLVLILIAGSALADEPFPELNAEGFLDEG